MGRGKNLNQETELLIFDVSMTVFQEKGYAATKLQDIAQRANINQSLLHYYFRNKENLFKTVLRHKVLQLFAELETPLRNCIVEHGKLTVKSVIEAYQGYFYKNPNFPLFVIAELNNNPKIMKEIFSEIELNSFKNETLKMIKEVLADIDTDVDTEQLLVSLISMIIFPFMGRELLKLIFDKTEKQYQVFMNQRNEMLWSISSKLL